MTVLETVAQAQLEGFSVERLVCHPRLPLAAGLDSERPTVRIWSWGDGNLREVAPVAAGSQAYADKAGWERRMRTPSVAWHPHEPLLLAACESKLTRWADGSIAELGSAGYRYVVFSPDGDSVWAAPSAATGERAWDSSDILSGVGETVGIGPGWDTGIGIHPEGTLVLTLCSNQGATLGVFARVDRTQKVSRMQVQRRAIVLEADGYETPMFSPDGRHIVIRGNAYGHTVDVFEFPSLQRVISTSLSSPTPKYPYPQGWLDELMSWASHNLAFGSQSGVLWIGTPDGTLLELNIDEQEAAEHTLAGVSGISALSSTSTGHLLAACASGRLQLPQTPAISLASQAKPSSASQFLNNTTDLPDGLDDVWSNLTLTDGERTWDADDRATVTTATQTDPGWLQITAQMNRMRDQPLSYDDPWATAALVDGPGSLFDDEPPF